LAFIPPPLLDILSFFFIWGGGGSPLYCSRPMTSLLMTHSKRDFPPERFGDCVELFSLELLPLQFWRNQQAHLHNSTQFIGRGSSLQRRLPGNFFTSIFDTSYGSTTVGELHRMATTIHYSSVAEPKLFVSAPATAPTFKKFRLQLRLQLGRHQCAQVTCLILFKIN
jgi:hypothetical protein